MLKNFAGAIFVSLTVVSCATSGINKPLRNQPPIVMNDDADYVVISGTAVQITKNTTRIIVQRTGTIDDIPALVDDGRVFKPGQRVQLKDVSYPINTSKSVGIYYVK